MSRREERFEIDVDASPEEVWERLTTADGLASWFGTRATIDLRVGGNRVVGWGDSMEISGRIEEIEPPRRIRVVYTADGEETGAEEWLITTDGTTTRLTLVNSFADDDIEDWAEFFGDIRRGWHLFLASLKHALERAGTPNRTAECQYVPTTKTREDLWKAVDGVLRSHPSLVEGMEPRLTDRPHSRLLAADDRTLLIDVEGSGPDQVVFVQAATHGGPGQWRGQALEVMVSSLANLPGVPSS